MPKLWTASTTPLLLLPLSSSRSLVPTAGKQGMKLLLLACERLTAFTLQLRRPSEILHLSPTSKRRRGRKERRPVLSAAAKPATPFNCCFPVRRRSEKKMRKGLVAAFLASWSSTALLARGNRGKPPGFFIGRCLWRRERNDVPSREREERETKKSQGSGGCWLPDHQLAGVHRSALPTGNRGKPPGGSSFGRCCVARETEVERAWRCFSPLAGVHALSRWRLPSSFVLGGQFSTPRERDRDEARQGSGGCCAADHARVHHNHLMKKANYMGSNTWEGQPPRNDPIFPIHIIQVGNHPNFSWRDQGNAHGNGNHLGFQQQGPSAIFSISNTDPSSSHLHHNNLKLCFRKKKPHLGDVSCNTCLARYHEKKLDAKTDRLLIQQDPFII
nr:uncharacterized protein LOC109192492 [Ipomoea batatas]